MQSRGVSLLKLYSYITTIVPLAHDHNISCLLYGSVDIGNDGAKSYKKFSYEQGAETEQLWELIESTVA